MIILFFKIKMPYTGDKFCCTCFDKRKDSASNYHYENTFKNNWGLYFIPCVREGLLIAKGIKSLEYPGGNVYHVYTCGRHEKWSKNEKGANNLQKCNECNNYVSSYYQLEAYE